MHTVGNGGSSTDAARFARLLRTHDVRASCLASDPAILTALANDLGADRIFARQVEAGVRPGDVLLIEVDLLRCRGKLGKAKGVCKVGNDIVSEAEVSFVLMDS